MAIYYCHCCDNYRDNDYDTMQEDPRDTDSPDGICTGCYEELVCEQEEADDQPWSQVIKGATMPRQIRSK
jgi:hypothetical protein